MNPMPLMRSLLTPLAPLAVAIASLVMMANASGAELWAEFRGGEGPGAGKKIVLVSGDEEYRSEEALPQLAKILSQHHGFDCTVLFAIDRQSGEIDPTVVDNIRGLEALADADLMIIATRFRNLPDDQMQHIVDYVEAGKPILGMRTATHAFKIPEDRKFARYGWTYAGDDYKQGFGRQVLGETWIAHHGHHKHESTRGIVAPGAEDHPITRGIEDGDIWGPTDVYTVRLPLAGDSEPLILGQVLTGMQPSDPPVVGEKNDPMMPIAWTRTYKGARVFTTTMGAATDLASEGVRRMLVNAAFWCLAMEDEITPDLNVSIVGEYQPTPYGFGGHQKGRVPSDYELP